LYMIFFFFFFFLGIYISCFIDRSTFMVRICLQLVDSMDWTNNEGISLFLFNLYDLTWKKTFLFCVYTLIIAAFMALIPEGWLLGEDLNTCYSSFQQNIKSISPNFHIEKEQYQRKFNQISTEWNDLRSIDLLSDLLTGLPSVGTNKVLIKDIAAITRRDEVPVYSV